MGAGTFLPVKADDTDDRDDANGGDRTGNRNCLNRQIDGRLIAVGTTSLRLLESATDETGDPPFAGDTSIFITPGYRFRAVDGLMTNFHLPNHPDDAGQRFDGPRADDGHLRPRHRRTVPLLQLWRFLALAAMSREMSEPILDITGLTKVYPGGLTALADVDLEIRKGEIFALLGPNGAGKTTLIGAVCGLVRPTSGTIRAFGEDLQANWRTARSRIGLVPQELSTDMFEPVIRSVAYSRGLFGHAPDPKRIEEILRSLS